MTADRGAPLADLPGGDALLALVRGWPGVERVTLFGSRARGDHRPASDVDLALEAPTLGLDGELRLRAAIEELGLVVAVDLVRLRPTTDPALRAAIAREGREVRAPEVPNRLAI